MERRITAGTRVVLEGGAHEAALGHPLFAINWFNTRSLWLYDVYNAAAAGSVLKVGATVFFKGHLIETLAGNDEEARRVLLIVNYPSGERFLELLSGKLFQVVSLLRTLAVRDFSFALNQRVDGPALPEHGSRRFERGRAWAIHHFASDTDVREDLTALRTLAGSGRLSLHFASQKVAAVCTETDGGTRRQIAHITDKVVLFEADTRDRLRQGLLSPSYREFCLAQHTSYVGLLDRVM
jgi:uncharacterized protein (DUF1330 family)